MVRFNSVKGEFYEADEKVRPVSVKVSLCGENDNQTFF